MIRIWLDLFFYLVASSTLDVQIGLVGESATGYVKGGIQCLAASYPLLFRVLYVAFFVFWLRSDAL